MLINNFYYIPKESLQFITWALANLLRPKGKLKFINNFQ